MVGTVFHLFFSICLLGLFSGDLEAPPTQMGPREKVAGLGGGPWMGYAVWIREKRPRGLRGLLWFWAQWVGTLGSQSIQVKFPKESWPGWRLTATGAWVFNMLELLTGMQKGWPRGSAQFFNTLQTTISTHQGHPTGLLHSRNVVLHGNS